MSNWNTKILNEACTPVVFFSSNYLCRKLSRWTRLLPEANISFKDTAPLSTCRCLVSSLYRAPAAEMEDSVQLTDFRALRRSSSVGDLDNCEYLKLACISLILQFGVFVTSFISYHYFWLLTCKKYNCKL